MALTTLVVVAVVVVVMMMMPSHLGLLTKSITLASRGEPGTKRELAQALIASGNW
jgi:hypothetical protein